MSTDSLGLTPSGGREDLLPIPETQQSICNWANATFGTGIDLPRWYTRLMEEIGELGEAILDEDLEYTPLNGSAPPLSTRESQAFYRQLVASIEAAKSAEEHAARIGHPVTFSSEDIRALAISGFIQQAREGY
jgi:hypothetical protein